MIRTVASLALLAAGCHSVSGSAPDDTRPNIVLVMTDDQGYGDYGFMGNPVLETPNLDALALESPHVERFYVSPVCSPTRACLMTGRYNYRTRVIDTWRGRSMMDPDELTLAEILRGAGYATGVFGKWHLGDAHPMRPIDQGFERSLVHRGGGLAQLSEPLENRRRYTDALLLDDGELVPTQGYCTDVYFEAATAFIDDCIEADRPFFAYIATNAPHDPLHDVPGALYEKYRGRDMSSVQRASGGSDGMEPDKLARIFAMIENIDQNVGRMRRHLVDRGVDRDTLFVFLGDNGPVRGRKVAGLRGHKAQVYEGGIRTPLLASWPEVLSPDTTVGFPRAHIDILPTLLEASGVAAPPDLELDGKSFWDAWTGAGDALRERHLVLQSHRGDQPVAEHQFTVIGPRWKLVRNSGFGRETPREEQPFELFDLDVDPSESTDLAEEHPEVVRELRGAYARWFEDVSSEREDNYAPPRIVVGTGAEREATLSRQDWRAFKGGGWGSNGVWHLSSPRPCELEVTLVFREPARVDSLVAHFGDRARPLNVESSFEGTHLLLGRLPFPAGDIDLWFACTDGEESSAPYQVLLEQTSTASIVVASDLDNPPFAGVDAQGRPTGRDVEMMQLLAERLGRPLEWKRMPFEELLPAAERGEVDAVCATLGITPEREERVLFTNTYYETAITVLVRTGSGEPRTIGALKKKRVGAGSGTTSERAVRRRLEGSYGIFENKEGLPTARRLLENELDAAVMDGPAADAIVASSNGKLTRLPENLDAERYGIALPRSKAGLRERLNHALRELQASGELASLNEKHGL